MAGRALAAGVWLLEIELSGHIYRFATEPVTVLDQDGREHLYAEGLSEPSVSRGSVTGVEEASVGVEIASEVDWALLVARGHALDESPATIRRWHPRQTLERAWVALRGRLRDASYGAAGEPMAVSVVRSPREQSGLLPPAQAVVDSSTWPITTSPAHEILDGIEGAVYPLVIGAPGGTEEAEPKPAVPVPMAEYATGETTTSRVIWLGGHAQQVRLFDRKDRQSGDRAVSVADDLLGRQVQYALPLVSLIAEDAEYWVGFRDDATYGGGLRTHRGELLRGAGDVIEWVLRGYYDGAVDWARLDNVRARLNSYKIDTYINSTVNAWDWLGSEILPLLPVEMREGERGIYPALISWGASLVDVVAHLDATISSGSVQRESPVTTVGEIKNEIVVDYRPSSESGSGWLARRAITARAGRLSAPYASAGDTRIYESQLCAESQRRYGARPLQIQAGCVWDTGTAVLVARTAVQRYAWLRRAVRYSGGAWLETLGIGEAVTLTDPELHLRSALALVGDVLPTAAGAELDLLILDHPLLRDRAVR